MSTALIVGLGGVGSVTAQKCFQAPETFTKLILASRSIDKCKAVKNRLGNPENIITEKVNADRKSEVITLLQKHKPDILINTALPYQDLTLMRACLEIGTHYLDTANYESPEKEGFEYKEQWAFHERFRKKGIMALLGSGFDPGVTNVFIAYMNKHHFDEIHEIDIMDCNGGDHGHPFATNFNTEVNIREITQEGRYYEEGQWRSCEALSRHREFDFPGVGTREMYLMYHEELESIVKHFPSIKKIKFWMTFSQEYLNCLRVLQNVGMTDIAPVEYEGKKIVPLKFLQKILPTPSSLGEKTRGKTCIGCMAEGIKDGKRKKMYIYNICDHEKCFREVGSQAISYTTGVPAMIGAKMILEGKWKGKGVFNLEQMNPDPFMDVLNRFGLPWNETIQ